MSSFLLCSNFNNKSNIIKIIISNRAIYITKGKKLN